MVHKKRGKESFALEIMTASKHRRNDRLSHHFTFNNIIIDSGRIINECKAIGE